jgi:hypothetical protein
MSGRAKDWCILRTSGRNTLALVESLNADGFTAWTPVERRLVRKHRSPAKEEIALPIMPSFVFAKFGGCELRLSEFLALSMQPRKRQPDFSVMLDGHDPAVTRDASLNPLRALEERMQERLDRDKFKDRGRVLSKGTTVRIPDNLAFAGLEGIVEADNGKKALVCFGGRIAVAVESFVLRTEGDMREAA